MEFTRGDDAFGDRILWHSEEFTITSSCGISSYRDTIQPYIDSIEEEMVYIVDQQIPMFEFQEY